MAASEHTPPGRTTASSGSTKQQVKHQARELKEQAKDTAQDLGQQAQDQAQQLASQAREQITTQLAGQKDRATDQLGSISSALHRTSENLHDEDQDAVARYIGDAAQQVDRLSDYLRTHTVSELLSEAERYARREPALFLGGAMLVGLLGARFLKSSRPGSDYDRYGDRSGGQAYRGYAPPRRYQSAPAGRYRMGPAGSYRDDYGDEPPYRERRASTQQTWEAEASNQDSPGTARSEASYPQQRSKADADRRDV